ncbi:MAG: lipid A deacylase LpxR family protein [Rhodospirillales bacterium]|nr:lipid A deacylase LpxR family protein [Rhodospirillales bacterium]
MKHLYTIPVLLGLAVVLGSVPVFAQEDIEQKTAKRDVGTFSFQLENDLFAGTDRHYTNGTRISWLSPDGETIEFLDTMRDTLKSVAMDATGSDGRDKEVRFGVSLGQDIYTPENGVRTDLVTDDRPYAGWLYMAKSLHTITKSSNRAQGRPDRLESVEFQLGIVGPAALGKAVQNEVHELRNIDTFKGWQNQLHNEPGLMLLYERKWRVDVPTRDGFGEIDVIPRMGGSIGNVLTHANMGGAVRGGWNLPEDFGPANLIQGGAPFMDTNRDMLELASVYLFASAEGRVVAHNIFLDGNTFRSSHSVDKRNLVGDLTFGATLMLGPVNLTYSNTHRSREFEGQQGTSRFGALTVSFEATF